MIVQKYSTVVATIATLGAEQIRVGANANDYLDFDTLLLDDIGEFVFVWTGTVWECNF